MADRRVEMVSPACPNPYETHGVVLCGCSAEQDHGPLHWMFDGAAFFCRCGPREHPPRGSGLVWDANPDGYACRECVNRLPSRAWMRRLNCDMDCCWCGGLARGNHGFRIYGHPRKEEA